MELYNIIKFTNSRRDICLYILIAIVLITIFKPYYYTIIFIFIALMFISTYVSYGRLDKFKIYKNQLNKLNFVKLDWINNDIIINYYINLLDLKSYNENAFENSIINMNEFVKIVECAKSENISREFIEEAIYRRDKGLNELMSIVVSIKYSDVKRLEKMTQELKADTDAYILIMEYRYNTQNNIPLGRIVDPKSNPYSDVLFSNKFNIY